MKIEGLKPLRRRGTYRMVDSEGRGVDLVVSPLPLAVEWLMQEELPDPAPPRKVSGVNASGPVAYSDETDPDFLRSKARNERAQTAWLMAQILRDDPRLSFESVKSKTTAAVDHWVAIHDELIEFGFTGAHFQAIQRASVEVSTVTEETIEDAKENLAEADPVARSG